MQTLTCTKMTEFPNENDQVKRINSNLKYPFLQIQSQSPILTPPTSLSSIQMASISSSFHCISISPNSSISTSSFSPPVTPIRFNKAAKPRPISAVCATAPSVAERSKTTSFYDLLGVQSGASSQEIKSAYRRLARVLHPDVVSANGQNDAASASEFIRVHEAYATLSDPGKRADYDRALFLRSSLMNGSSSSFVSRGRAPSASRFTSRSWETDQCW